MLPLSQLPITADKREIKDFPKLHLVTSFIRETLYDIGKLIGLDLEI